MTTGVPLATALGLGRTDLEALVRFAERDFEAGRFAQALETLRVAAVLDPRQRGVFTALARVYRKLGESGRAISAERVAAALSRFNVAESDQIGGAR